MPCRGGVSQCPHCRKRWNALPGRRAARRFTGDLDELLADLVVSQWTVLLLPLPVAWPLAWSVAWPVAWPVSWPVPWPVPWPVAWPVALPVSNSANTTFPKLMKSQNRNDYTFSSRPRGKFLLDPCYEFFSATDGRQQTCPKRVLR